MLATSPNQAGQSRLYSTAGTLFFCLFNKHVKTLQERLKQAVFHLFTECMDWLFHKITEWCIKYGAIKTTEKLFLNVSNNA